MTRPLLAFVLLLAAIPAARADSRHPCASPAAQGRGQFLPAGRLFRPLLADVKEPRFSAAYHRLDFRNGPGLPASGRGEIKAGLISLGGTLGVWRIGFGTGPCDGIQVSAAAGVFSLFNLDAASKDLINSDFTVGVPVTFRLGRLSGRVQLYHQSSHFGDDFLINNPGAVRHELNIDWVDGVLAVEGDFWRVYGGGGWWFRRGPRELDLEPFTVQWGAELRSPAQNRGEGVFLRATAAADFTMLQTRDWDLTTSAKGGVEIGRGRTRLRLLGVYLRGVFPLGQFFVNEDVESYGVEIQIEF